MKNSLRDFFLFSFYFFVFAYILPFSSSTEGESYANSRDTINVRVSEKEASQIYKVLWGYTDIEFVTGVVGRRNLPLLFVHGNRDGSLSVSKAVLRKKLKALDVNRVFMITCFFGLYEKSERELAGVEMETFFQNQNYPVVVRMKEPVSSFFFSYEEPQIISLFLSIPKTTNNGDKDGT